jgi:hypothetical protein
VRHIALGRIDWFVRLDAPGSRELMARVSTWQDPHGNRYVEESTIGDEFVKSSV